MASPTASAAPSASVKPLFGGTAIGVIVEKLDIIILAADKQLMNGLIYIKDEQGKYFDIQYIKDPKEVTRVFSIQSKFGCAGVGLWNGPDGVLNWMKDLAVKVKVNDKSTILECRQILEDYRMLRFDKKKDKEPVEILLAGWDADDKPHLYTFNNAGNTPVKSGYCIGKGRSTALMAVINQEIENLTEADVVELIQRAIFDAHLSDETTGVGVSVLVIRRGSAPSYLDYKTMDQLKEKFGSETTGIEAFLKRKQERSEKEYRDSVGY